LHDEFSELTVVDKSREMVVEPCLAHPPGTEHTPSARSISAACSSSGSMMVMERVSSSRLTTIRFW
jgi:hypothetical protein